MTTMNKKASIQTPKADAAHAIASIRPNPSTGGVAVVPAVGVSPTEATVAERMIEVKNMIQKTDRSVASVVSKVVRGVDGAVVRTGIVAGVVGGVVTAIIALVVWIVVNGGVVRGRVASIDRIASPISIAGAIETSGTASTGAIGIAASIPTGQITNMRIESIIDQIHGAASIT